MISPHDRHVAMQRLVHEGVTLTTSESVVFELMGCAEIPEFKAISGLLKEHNKLPNEFADDSTF